jgi:hypothetical protein
MYVYTVQRIIIEQTLSTGFIFGNSIYAVGKSLFYLLPLIVSVWVSIICVKQQKQLLFLPIFVGIFYVLGIRPTTDFIHLTPLLSLLGVAFLPIYSSQKKGIIKHIAFVCSIILIFIGIYAAYFSGFYKWEPERKNDIYFSPLPKTAIFLDDYHKNELESLQKEIQKRTKKSEYIYVYGYIPLLYFITDRQNPTPYDLIEPTEFYNKVEKDVIRKLQKNHVRVVLTTGKLGETNVGEYIQKEYTISSKINGFFLWEKR